MLPLSLADVTENLQTQTSLGSGMLIGDHEQRVTVSLPWGLLEIKVAEGDLSMPHKAPKVFQFSFIFIPKSLEPRNFRRRGSFCLFPI